MHTYQKKKKKRKRGYHLVIPPAQLLEIVSLEGSQARRVGSSISRETVFVNQRRARLNKTNNACFALELAAKIRRGGRPPRNKGEEDILDKRQRNVPVLRGDVIALPLPRRRALEARRKREGKRERERRLGKWRGWMSGMQITTDCLLFRRFCSCVFPRSETICLLLPSSTVPYLPPRDWHCLFFSPPSSIQPFRWRVEYPARWENASRRWRRLLTNRSKPNIHANRYF